MTDSSFPSSSSASGSSTTSSPGAYTPSQGGYTPPSSPSFGSGDYSSSEWTQQNMLADLMQQKALWIALGALFLIFLFLRGRSAKPEEQAARRLVRDFRHLGDPDDVREALTDNLPTIVRPALLIALEEIQRQVHRGFRNAERAIEKF